MASEEKVAELQEQLQRMRIEQVGNVVEAEIRNKVTLLAGAAAETGSSNVSQPSTRVLSYQSGLLSA